MWLGVIRVPFPWSLLRENILKLRLDWAGACPLKTSERGTFATEKNELERLQYRRGQQPNVGFVKITLAVLQGMNCLRTKVGTGRLIKKLLQCSKGEPTVASMAGRNKGLQFVLEIESAWLADSVDRDDKEMKEDSGSLGTFPFCYGLQV